jgi:hypothetical protein
VTVFNSNVPRRLIRRISLSLLWSGWISRGIRGFPGRDPGSGCSTKPQMIKTIRHAGHPPADQRPESGCERPGKQSSITPLPVT